MLTTSRDFGRSDVARCAFGCDVEAFPTELGFGHHVSSRVTRVIAHICIATGEGKPKPS